MTHYPAQHRTGARVDDSWTYRGLKTVIIENDLLRATVIADKGADIVGLVHKPTDTEFLWRTPWGIRDPRLYTPTTGDGLTWLDHYEGGWQTVVPAAGNPSGHGGAPLGLHGEANLMPWDARIDNEGPQTAVASFTARLARTPFVVKKTITVESGSPRLSVEETITNVGTVPFPVVYGHHITLGAPFLTKDCVIDLPGGTVLTDETPVSPSSRLKSGSVSKWPMAALTGGGEADLSRVPGPQDGYEDLVYVADLPKGWYAVTNPQLGARGVGIAVTFPHEVFRYLWYWQVFGGGERYPWWGQTYNIGLEPYTSYPNLGLEEAVRNESALQVAAGESISTKITATLFEGAGVTDVDEAGNMTLATQPRPGGHGSGVSTQAAPRAAVAKA